MSADAGRRGRRLLPGPLHGSLATDPGSRWYRTLDLPGWQPPKGAFPLVWTGLYGDLALTSAATVTAAEREGDRQRVTTCWRALAVNLALNTGWSVLFWRVHRPGAAAIGAAARAASSAELVLRGSAGAVVVAAWRSRRTHLKRFRDGALRRDQPTQPGPVSPGQSGRGHPPGCS